LIKISHCGSQITVHTKSNDIGNFITNPSHYPRYKNFTPESLEYRALYKEKMLSVGSHADKIFSLILENEPKHWYRITTGILSLRKVFSDNIVDLACKRALGFNITSYSKIRNICQSGSYNLPLEQIEEEVYESTAS